MDIRLDGRVALVTGASSGIGRQAALMLAQSGADLCVQGYTHMDSAEEVAHEAVKMGRRAIAVKADVTDSTSVSRMVRDAKVELGGLDIGFANAGVFEMASLDQTSDDVWARHFAVNVTGAFYCARSLVPEMKRRGRGKLIFTGSIFGANGVSDAAAYCSTKMAIHGLTRALAIELAPSSINVNAVAPGNVVTPLNNPLYDYVAAASGKPHDREAGKAELVKAYPWGRLGEVGDIASAVVYLASEASDFITGQIIFVDGGYSVR